MQLGEIPIERPQVAALNEDALLAAKDDRPKTIPLGLVQEIAGGRQLIGELREHRLDWRLNGESHGQGKRCALETSAES